MGPQCCFQCGLMLTKMLVCCLLGLALSKQNVISTSLYYPGNPSVLPCDCSRALNSFLFSGVQEVRLLPPPVQMILILCKSFWRQEIIPDINLRLASLEVGFAEEATYYVPHVHASVLGSALVHAP